MLQPAREVTGGEHWAGSMVSGSSMEEQSAWIGSKADTPEPSRPHKAIKIGGQARPVPPKPIDGPIATRRGFNVAKRNYMRLCVEPSHHPSSIIHSPIVH